MQLQHARELVQRRSGGHDVVDHGDGLAFQVDAAFEGMADVGLAFLPRQAGLRCAVAHAQAGVRQQRQAEMRTRQRPGDFLGLVEAALASCAWLRAAAG
jgi:hypothetical protein